jgi:hypothetical protein
MLDKKSYTWKNVAYVFAIPTKDKGNLIVGSFVDYRFDITNHCLEDYDFSGYENQLIGFFVTLVSTQNDYDDYLNKFIPGEINVIAEDGKISYIHNLKKFEQYGTIDLVELNEFYGENFDELFNKISLEEIELEKPLFLLEQIQMLDPEFLNYSEEDLFDKETQERLKYEEFLSSISELN